MSSQVNEHVRFGAFIPPLHDPAQNPTLALQRDLELVAHLDHLGFAEVWFGEHHGLGWEIIPEPEIFIAAAAQHTSQIKLCTGVVSLPYHHPMVLADRWVFLDHLTRGRIVIGVGPGAFPSDAYQMGIPYDQNRVRMEEALEAILALIDGDEPVTRETAWFKLQEARLNLRPFTRPRFEIAVASVVSPSGAKLAGRHGLGLLSIAAGAKAGIDALKDMWAVVEQEAAEYGQVVDRSGWRVNNFFHIADTESQARKDVRFGLKRFCDYRHGVNPASRLHDPSLTDIDDIIDDMQKNGLVVIGTPDRLVEHVRQQQLTTGGFGAYLSFATEMANREATMYSYELVARHVMPQFDGSTVRPNDAYEFATSRDWATPLQQAWQAAKDAYASEREAGRVADDVVALAKEEVLRVPFCRNLGLRFVDAGRCHATVVLPEHPEHGTNVDTVHPLIVASPAEAASGFVARVALHPLVEAGATTLMKEAALRLRAPARGVLTGVAEASDADVAGWIKAYEANGRVDAEILTRVIDEGGVLVLELRTTWAVRPPKEGT